jgi:hypothetical protein
MLLDGKTVVEAAKLQVEAPGTVTILTEKSRASAGEYTVYWKAVDGAKGYVIELFDDSGERMLRKSLAADRKKYTFSQIEEGNYYRVRIRAYAKQWNLAEQKWERVYGKAREIYIQQQPVVSFTLKDKKTVRLSWEEVSNVREYRVYLSETRGQGYKLVKTVKKNHVKLKNLKKNRVYYVYVEARYRVGKKNWTTPVTCAYPFSIQR